MRSELLGLLPRPKLKKIVVARRQDVPIIMAEVLKAHKDYANNYDKIAEAFQGKTLYQTLERLFRFCKLEMRYKAESDKSQTLRSPGAILKTANTIGVDCKHYAGFIGGVLDALNRMGQNINWCYRFVSYSPDDSTPEHVFIVVNDGKKNIYVDPVLTTLDSRNPKFYYFTDKFPRMLYRINGPQRNNKPARVGLMSFDYSGDIVKTLQTIAPVQTPVKQSVTVMESVKKIPGWVWVVGAVGLYLVLKKKK